MMEDVSGSAEQVRVEMIRDRIGSLVNKHFATGADKYYLSQLGNELGNNRVLLEKLTRRKLSDFVEKEFGFEIGRTGQHHNVLYLVRPGQAGAPTEPPKPDIPRYTPRFWAAFAVPLEAGQRRYINLNTLEFGPDEAALKAAGTDVRDIEPEYIAPREASGSATDIASRIDRWLQDQQLDRTPFLFQRRQTAGEASASLLDHLLAALDGDQLKRASLPLDIVRTLSEHRVR